jgi:putative isomerase
MDRREFMKWTGAGLIGAGLPAAAAGKPIGLPELDEADIRSLCATEDPALLTLTQRVFNRCILDNIHHPKPPLKQRWVRPGGPHYLGQWIWDTMFVVDLLSILPGKKKLIRDIFQNYWDFQDRWNRWMPDYAHDMICGVIKTAPQDVRKFSQIPILAWGVERVYRRNGDTQLLDQSLARLERFHEWFWRERDLTDRGLIALGAYSGVIQHARWETFDHDCALDHLKLTRHPAREGPNEGKWYGDICTPGNTSYLLMAEKSLAWLAEQRGDAEMAARRRARIDRGVQAMREHMWDDRAGTFLAVKRDSLEKIRVATISSWIPLWAGVPTQSMARKMARTLQSDSFQTPLPVPTVDPTDERFQSNAFWRGDVWPPTNYQIASGLAAYGHSALAADIADKTIANAMQHHISERYDSVSGKPLGIRDYCMSATLVTMMLDGVSRKHTLRLRDA